MNLWYHIKAVIDFKNKRIISFEIVQIGSSPENKRSFTNLPFVNTGATDVSRLEIAGTRGKGEGGTSSGGNCDFAERFDNIDIYTMHQVAAAANVTVRYKDASGMEISTARVITNQAVSSVYKALASDKLNIIYGGDYYIYDQTSIDSATVAIGGSEINLRFNKATPKNTVVTISAPTIAELYHDVTVNFTVKTPTSDPVSQGTVNILVSGVLKNTVIPDALGKCSITFPNLLVGTENIKAFYVGDRIAYTSSDTVGVSVVMTPSTSSVIPYPVYYDLGTMPEIMKYRLKYTTATTARTSIAFAGDSLKSFTLSTDTLTTTKNMYANWGAYAFTIPLKTADYYGASDAFNVPYGNGVRPSWMSFATPWLNKGAYNIYMNQRTNLLTDGMKTTALMDGKSLYYPNAELLPYSIRSNGNNNGRRWNANTNDVMNQMAYLGSVVIDASGVHTLKLSCTSTSETGVNQIAWLDMMEFVPVDQDSVNVNITAKAGLAKTYYPLFNSGGYALPNITPFVTYASCNDLAVSYQAVDQTVYAKNPCTLQHLGVTDPNLGLMGVDYIVVFKNDKWTRVSEGMVNTSDSTYTCNLADGEYYYQEYNYTENPVILGSMGSRIWMKDGMFNLKNGVITGSFIGISTSVSKTNLSYDIGSGPSAEQSFTVEGLKLTDNIVITPSANIQISKTSGSGFVNTPITLSQGSGSVASTLIYVRLKAGLGNGNYKDSIVLSSTGVTTQKIICHSSVNGPSLTTSTSSVTGLNYLKGSGPSLEQLFTLSGTLLESDITVTPSANIQISKTSGSAFTNSAITFSLTSGTLSSSFIYVRLKAGLTNASYSDSILITSTNAVANKVMCSGTVLVPQINVSELLLTGLNYSYNNGPSDQQSFTVSGTDLSGNITITPSANYQVSILSGGSFTTSSINLTPSLGILSPTTIYIRLKAGLAEGNYSGSIMVSSTVADTKTISCNGTVYSGTITNAPNLTNNKIKVYSNQNGIIVEGTTNGEMVTLYSIYGIALQEVKSKGDKIVLPVNHDAVYLVKTTTKTFKVIM